MGRPTHPTSFLGRLLAAAGYHVEDRPNGLLAVRARDRRAVALAGTRRPVAEVERWFPSDTAYRTIVYDEDPGTAARDAAADRGIEVLDPSTLGAALSEILLPSPLTAVAGPDAQAELEAPFAVLPAGSRIVRPRLSRREAELIAAVDTPRLTLRLVPFYVAPYRVRPSAPDGGPGTVLDRTVAVHAVSGRAEVWEEGDRELVSNVEGPHQFVAPEVPLADATGLALAAIRHHHTVRVEHSEQHDGALILETRRVPPSADDLRLGPLELIFVPHWYAEAAEGRVVLDAVSGRRLGVPVSSA